VPGKRTFTSLRVSCVQLRTKFEQNRIIHHWVVDDLARFRLAILGLGYDWQTFLRGAWTQLHQTLWEHKAIIPTQEVCFSVRISCCIFKRERSKLSDVENDAKLCTFWPLWKLGKGWARSLLTSGGLNRKLTRMKFSLCITHVHHQKTRLASPHRYWLIRK